MHVPVSTYRLQFTPDFGFDRARDIVPYLKRLGISDAYNSPIFASKPGSNHGYDLVSMRRLNDELGGEPAFEKYVEALRVHGMGMIQDIVPNHRAFHGTNTMLMDILEQGPYAKYYNYYDIAWDHTYVNIRGRLLAPFLGDLYGRCLERGEIQFAYRNGTFTVNYYELSLPLSIQSYRHFMLYNIDRLQSVLSSSRGDYMRFKAITNFISRLDAERAANPQFDYPGFIKEIINELYEQVPAIQNHIDDNLAELNSPEKTPEQFDFIDLIMSEQYFRLSYWKVGTEELNYRRFFSINDLIALRVEQEEVFEETHSYVLGAIASGKMHGVRVDHVDGLYDPGEYLERLRRRAPKAYIVVEKILEHGEQLPKWPINGTTGYEFMDAAAAVLCNANAETDLEQIYRGFTGLEPTYEALVRDNKRNIIGRHMAGDIDNLALMLKGFTNKHRIGNDLTMYAVRRAMVEILTHFPVYRTYISNTTSTPEDRDVLEYAIRKAKETLPIMRIELDVIGSFLLGIFQDGEQAPGDRDEWIEFLMRVQQYTGPLMAKGVEDTTFFVYNRLIARNEVGSDPRILGISPTEFHQAMIHRQREWPHTMNSTSTHDTKRSEDTRARILAIADDPHQWQEHLLAWHHLNLKHKTKINGRDCPAPNDEYHLYQALLGCMPAEGFNHDDFPARFKEYLVKAVRESKVESSWLTPNEPYEKALTDFAEKILDPEASADFHAAFLPYFVKINTAGMLNSLSQVVLKCMCPGVPDVYQGCETWNLSFVDPDNRRPVDFEKLERQFSEIQSRAGHDPAGLLRDALAAPGDGKIKMYVLHRCLALRAARPLLFEQGAYTPIETSGPNAAHLLAFERHHEGSRTIVIVTRLMSRLHSGESLELDESIWNETTVRLPKPAAQYESILTSARHHAGGDTPAGALLGKSPVAVLVTEG